MGAGSRLSPPIPPCLAHFPLHPTLPQIAPKVAGEGKKGPGGFRFSTQVGQELFLHPRDLGHLLVWAAQVLGQGLS